MNAERTGQRIAERRKAMKLTQEGLAEKLYVSRSAVSKWERGKSLPEISMLEPLAEVLGISIPELISEDGEEACRQDTAIKEVIDMAAEESRKGKHRILFLLSAILLCILAVRNISYLEPVWDVVVLMLLLCCGYLAWRVFSSSRKRTLVWVILALCAGMILFMMKEIHDRDHAPVLSTRRACYTTVPDPSGNLPVTGWYILNIMPNEKQYGMVDDMADDMVERHNEYMLIDYPMSSWSEDGPGEEHFTLSDYGIIYGTYRVLAENTIQLDCEILGDPVVVMEPGAEEIRIYVDGSPDPLVLQYAGDTPTVVSSEAFGPDTTLDYRDYAGE